MARPVFTDLERSGADVALEVLAVLALVLLVGNTIYFYPQLPDNIPEHFNFSGEADSWGGKGSILPLPILGLLVYAGLTVLARFPHVFNYPCPITEANARRQYTLARQLLSAVKLLVLSTFAYITWGQMATAQGKVDGLSPWFPLLIVPSLFLVMGMYLYRAQRSA